MTSPTTAPSDTTAGDLRTRWPAAPWWRSVGGVLLPLRAFLGVTFLYAGVSKLLDPQYLDPRSTAGVRAQMLLAADGSPISGLVSASAGHPTVTGLLIAFGEIAVGAGALLGLLTRLAAAGGALLALSFFLTVSWSTRPYYHGADLAYAFAWTPLLLAGDGGLLSLTARLRAGARRRMGLPPRPTPRENILVSNAVERRTVMRGGLIAAAAGAVTVVAGTAVAFARRGTAASTPAASAPAASGTPSSGATGSARVTATGPVVIASVAAVPVGSVVTFTAPAGGPAVLLHPSKDRFVAFDAACPHKGCPVTHVAGTGFTCPCHGATFDEAGQVTAGPARTPLASIPVTVTADGKVSTV